MFFKLKVFFLLHISRIYFLVIELFIEDHLKIFSCEVKIYSEGRNVASNKFNWSSIFQCADFTPPFSFKLLSVLHLSLIRVFGMFTPVWYF